MSSQELLEFRRKVQGTWQLLSYRAEPLNNDDPIYPFTKDAQGIVIYSSDGYMSAQLMAPRRVPFHTPDRLCGTETELADAMRSYMAYSGKFEVYLDSDGRPCLLHTMQVSSFPNWIGDTQERSAHITEDILTLSPIQPVGLAGKLVRPVLRLKKIT
ncbi:Lipocalin-like domain-containing protein [Talaromyces proteolyticus]|uniref:Lipocalin-like domain-containing protein n=1 Tax=Talaromyces proteolyticus TaxID=1131652 RepID=A0AAD4L2J5_9EURO|nr:Lipocalin-like domain-containing protein [Talaromyces proteolyticus]KAH8703389.1 Lipocalin-like domain-containing protein [Talaromyces proteolyticus]